MGRVEGDEVEKMGDGADESEEGGDEGDEKTEELENNDEKLSTVRCLILTILEVLMGKTQV